MEILESEQHNMWPVCEYNVQALAQVQNFV